MPDSRLVDSLSTLIQPAMRTLRTVGVQSALTSLFWVALSAAIATGLASLATTPSDILVPLLAAYAFAIVGLSRGALDLYAGKLAFAAADQIIGTQRRALISDEATRSPMTSQIRSPLVASLAFGLLTATIASLLIVPSYFAFLDNIGFLHDNTG